MDAVTASERIDARADALFALRQQPESKGVLGRAIQEDVRYPSLVERVAKSRGIDIGADGRMRCPLTYTNGGEFTDLNLSNCGAKLPDGQTVTPKATAKKELDESILFQRVPLTADVVAYKAGLINSSSHSTQIGESAVSFAVPGDQSSIRHPVRSGIYSALTPGGGRNRLGSRIGRPNRVARCPAGFEYGGRFANSNFSNCGARLFAAIGESLLGAGAALAGRGRGDGNPLDDVGLIDRGAEAIGGGVYRGRAAQIARNAEIPPVGGRRPGGIAASINRLVNALDDPDSPTTVRLVRRDGVILAPQVDMTRLRGAVRNPDMDGGFLVTRAHHPNKIGDEHVPVLLATNLRGATFAIPGGGRIEIQKTRDLTSADRRRLNRAWNTAEGTDTYDVLARLRAVANASDGSVKLSHSHPQDNAERLVNVTQGDRSATVQRWVYDAYMADRAPGRIGDPWKLSDAPTEVASRRRKIDSLDAAVEHLNRGGKVADVPSIYLGDALARSRSFKRTQVDSGLKLYERGAERHYEVAPRRDFDHLAARMSADAQDVVGMESPDVRFMGRPGRRRPTLHEYPKGRLNTEAGYDTAPPDDMLRLAIADYLMDQTKRDASSLATVRRNGRARLVATENDSSGLVGLSGARRMARRTVALDDFYTDNRREGLLSRFSNLTPRQRQILLGTYDDAIARARKWSIEDYIATLTVDGELSPGERAHVEAMRALYEQRLDRLDGAKTKFLNLMGITQ